MKTRIGLLFVCLLLIASCKKKVSKEDYYKGNLTVLTDDSFKSVVEALGDAYSMAYPEAKVNVKVVKEDFGLLELLRQKAKLIVMSREMTPKEISEYERITSLDYNPAKFAADAVVFIVPSDSEKSSISVDEIKSALNSDNKDLVFDGTNSGNLNFVAQKLNKQPSELKFSIINGNENVIKEIGKYPGKIGIVSLNTISRSYDKDTNNLKKLIKILPVAQSGKSYNPADISTIRSMTYPFTRIIYFLGNEGTFQLANGFMRYSCTQLGQMVVQKEGLQPYNVYKREVQMR